MIYGTSSTRYPTSNDNLLGSLKKGAENLSNQYRYAAQRLKEEKQILKEAKRHLAHTEEAQRVVQVVAEGVQNLAHSQICKVVTKCLQAIFGDDYSFRIDFRRLRGKTEARLVVLKDGMELEDPVNEAGGGVIDVSAFALRLACLVLSRPEKRLLLVMDEPLRNIHGEEYQGKVGELLLLLAEDFGVQMVIVSDDPWMKIGRVIEL